MTTSQFANEYDLNSVVSVKPLGASFEMQITPRYRGHYTDQEYEKQTIDFFKRLASRAELFIDIGAHYGFYSLVGLSQNANLKVIALEPITESCTILRTNLSGHRGQFVRVVEAAASNVNGSADIVVSVASDNCSFYTHPNAPAKETRPVETVTIDSLLLDLEPCRTVIKMDTDGHEIAVLDGMVETLNRFKDLSLIVEFNPKMQKAAGYRVEELLGKLDQLGFAQFLITDEHGFCRLSPDTDWSKLMNASGYANIYCVPKDKALSVVLFSHSAYLAGAERSLLELVDELMSDFGAVCTVVLPESGPLEKTLVDSGAYCIKASTLPRWGIRGEGPLDRNALNEPMKLGACVTMTEVVPRVRIIDPDVVFTQTIVSPWGSLTAYMLGKPHVWSVCESGKDHGLFFPSELPDVAKAVDESSSHILTNSNYLSKQMFSGIAPDRISTVYRHIKISPSDLASQNELLQKNQHFTIGVFATLEAEKGQVDAIQALAKLIARGRSLELILAGYEYADYRKVLDDLSQELGVADRVKIVGFLEDQYSTMRRCDAIVITSRQEAFGRVALEAMVLGRPAIYPNCGAFPEYMIDGVVGLSYAPANVDELADCIVKLMDDGALRRQLAQNAQAYVAQKFSKEAYGGEIYRHLLNTKYCQDRAIKIPLVLRTAIADAFGSIWQQLPLESKLNTLRVSPPARLESTLQDLLRQSAPRSLKTIVRAIRTKLGARQKKP